MGKYLICKKCKKEFYVHNYRLDTATFCSISCKKKQKIKLGCLYCNIEFEVYPSSKDKKFCREKCYTLGGKKGRSPWNKGKTGVYSEQTLSLMSEAKKGIPLSEEHRASIGKSQEGKIVTEETRKLMKENHPRLSGKDAPMYGKTHSDKTIALMREKGIARFKDPVYLKNYQKGMQNSPNKLEIKFQEFLDGLFPNEWKFTGDFDVSFGRKSPDFFNIKDKCQVIELFGDYWHRNDDPQDRIDHFKEYGFDCLVIWELEFQNNLTETKDKVIRFHN